MEHNSFSELLRSLMSKRAWITGVVLVTFFLLTAGIVFSIHLEMQVSQEWKELLLLMLGAFIGSYGKIIDFWFQNGDLDRIITQKADEEDGAALSNTNDFKESTKPSTPIIPDAFVAAATGARELTATKNEQAFTLESSSQQHKQELEINQQQHEHEMEELKLMHELKALKYCEHEWGDFDADGQTECQKCGLIKDVWDTTQ